MTEYRVEELAEEAGVAVDTVRYYQRRALLAPPERRGRVAVYGDAHLDRLREIRRLADAGFTLAQIGELGDDRASTLLAELAARNAPDPGLDRAELARRADVPGFIIDIVVDAGLLEPVATGADDPASDDRDSDAEPAPGERFAPDAVDMLVAARTLVSEGVTLEELTALAMRHATHVEDVVDDAIELFKRHHDEGDGDRDDLIALMARLVPVASELVSRHFERTLRARALARIGDRAAVAQALGGGVVVVARRLADRVDPLAVHLGSDDPDRALWIRPELGLGIAGIGAVETIRPRGDGRFSAASAARAGLAARVHRIGPATAPAPVLLGGFSFVGADSRALEGIDRAARGPDWSGFPDARWVLPALTVIDRIDGTWALAAARVEAGDDERAAIDELDRRLDAFESDPPLPVVASPHGEGDPEADDPRYTDMVAAAVAAIHAGEMGKVVVARTQRVGPVDETAVLARLRARYPTCAVFAVAVGDRTFLGASPELLVTLDGRQVQTVALAGTTGVGWDATSDEGLATEMLASPKVRAEHRFVVDDITTRLSALGLVDATPAEPGVLRLARVQHLRTPITARIERRAGGVSDIDVLRVAGVLHPTAAVGGTPTQTAVEWLTRHEDFDRGWYAAPVGWCDLDGNGELRVALRSALVDPDGATLFSGAGIVADSEPDAELAETAVKLRALLDVMEH